MADVHLPQGLGEYYMNASIPSPIVNVLCANMTQEELLPMVYSDWPDEYRSNKTNPDTNSWPGSYDLSLFPNSTSKAVDELFDFDGSQKHPIFPKRPLPFNTVLNSTVVYGQESIYLLATSEDSFYTLCSLRAALTPNCSTEYHVTMSGGSLSVKCPDPNSHLAYSKSQPKAPNGFWDPNWKDVAISWATGLSLNSGITDGQSSNARMLTQMIPKTNALDPFLPSISEALAVLAGNTLLRSSLNSPFIHFWNYSTEITTLQEPQYQAFNATLAIVDYQSGGNRSWQRMFYIVLAVVFVANVCCLIYFLISGGLMTDFIEPQNLFCLALLSPPSEDLAGACGGGPDKEHFDTALNVRIDRQHDHLWIESSIRKRRAIDRHKRNRSSITTTADYEMQARPLSRAYSKIRRNRASVL